MHEPPDQMRMLLEARAQARRVLDELLGHENELDPKRHAEGLATLRSAVDATQRLLESIDRAMTGPAREAPEKRK